MRKPGQALLFMIVSAICFIVFVNTTNWLLLFASVTALGAALYSLGEKLISRLLAFAGCVGALLSAVVIVLAAIGIGAI